MLKFANKDATLMQHGGKSRVFLRKHIVNGKNVLCGCMISATNTIYILQYDYDLTNSAREKYTRTFLDANGEPCRAANGAWGVRMLYYPATLVR